MIAQRLIETAQAAGLSFEIDGGDLVVKADRAPPAELLAELRQHKAELIEVLRPGSVCERAALIEYGAGVSRRWAEGYAALCSIAAPSGFYPERWQRIVDAAGNFIDQWAVKAIACGWSDVDVFGADPDKPDRRFDCMGLLLLLDRCEIVGIDEHGADLIAMPGEAQLRYRRRPLPPGTVSLWQLPK